MSFVNKGILLSNTDIVLSVLAIMYCHKPV